MAVVTNKPYRFSIELLEGFGLLPYFPVVFGGDSCADEKTRSRAGTACP